MQDAASDTPESSPHGDECASSPCLQHELDRDCSLNDRYPLLDRERTVVQPPASSGWPDVRAWRRAQRSRLQNLRMAIAPVARTRMNARIEWYLDASIAESRCIAFYWPLDGEFDPRPLVGSLLARGADAALVVIVEKKQPMEFWRWRADSPMIPGVWGLPRPQERVIVSPTTILVPLLGFDASGYRLGHGGGYYDRTLAALDTKPCCVGVGYDCGRLATIHPQPHDVPMDVVVTESGAISHSV